MIQRFSLILFLFPFVLQAQNEAPVNCFNSVEILLPLAERAPGLAPAEVSYLDADDYTFWYRVQVSAPTIMKYYLAPINEKDRYESIAYRYSGTDLCQKLLKAPPRMSDSRRSDGPYEIVTISLEKDSTYYLSVLPMTAQDCGHYLVLWTNGDTLRLKAKHRDCPENGPQLLAADNFHALDTLPNDSAGMGALELLDVGLANVEDSATADLTEESIAPDNAEAKAEHAETPEGAASGMVIAVPATTGIAFIGASEDSTVENSFHIGDKAIMENIYFYPNTYSFKEAAREDLEALLEFMTTNQELSIEIQGHTASNARIKYVDPRYNGLGEAWTFTGTAAELSEKRAEAVKSYLSQRGIAAERISTKGFGGSQKLYNVDMDHHDFPKNMRVEVEITGIGAEKQ